VFRRKCLCLLLLGASRWAEATQAPATAGELTYFKFLLTELAGPLSTPSSVKITEQILAVQFGLNEHELSVIDSARLQMQPVLRQAREATQALVAGKQTLAQSDLAALAAVDTKMDQQIATIANAILNSVRPETAARLRVPGQLVTGHTNFSALAAQPRAGR
jgi:hypothetical protein